MADTVGIREEITVEDDSSGEVYSLTLTPNKLARQRKFIAAWGGIQGIDFGSDEAAEDKMLDVYTLCVAIALEPQFKKYFPNEKRMWLNSGEISKDYKEFVENCIDLPTSRKVLEICGGLQLEVDPKILETLAESQTA